MGGEEEEERSSPLSGASFSEIMGDMLAGRPALPREVIGHTRFVRQHPGSIGF